MKSMLKMWLRTRLSALDLLSDCSGIAATEFAMIVPIMLVMFFGTVEISSGVSVDRKVTLIARTLSDLPSQAGPPAATPNSPYAPVDDNYLQNVFTASIAIMKPYSITPTKVQVSEIYVDSKGTATVQWSRAATIDSDNATQATLAPTSSHKPGDTISIPSTFSTAASAAKQVYLIFSEVSYLYTPLGIGYVMQTNVTLSDVSYTRPRQVVCLVYTTPNPTLPPPDPATGVQCPTPP